jgi:hypothetical protein
MKRLWIETIISVYQSLESKASTATVIDADIFVQYFYNVNTALQYKYKT